jgi:hypothetical protein
VSYFYNEETIFKDFVYVVYVPQLYLVIFEHDRAIILVRLFYSFLLMNNLTKKIRKNCGTGIFINYDIFVILCLIFTDYVSNGEETVSKMQQQLHVIATFCYKSEIGSEMD